ncbi:uncharacterized protein K02A2.6-like [Alosa alosa]|uniref:uncharacterized protein K02A2.6-like n=1 Tax=Alosa alosa TaxID=278164 RepID=UPI0020153C84|nr:uncharacterized protein K02A2.6-like [Alosa alosa]
MSVHKNCVLWGNRVVIPEQVRKDVLALLHDAHPGIVRMKGIARSYVWWPGLDAKVEQMVRGCSTCQQSRHAPPKAPVHPWECILRRWSRLHIDFAGPFHGKVFLIVVDSYSKWLEVELVSSMSSSAVITTSLRKLMVTHGLPDVIVSDNVTAFTSAEFKRFVQRDWPTCLGRFLLAQHTTPHSVTQKSPAEMLMGRRLTTALDCLHPDFASDMQQKRQEAAALGQRPVRHFQVNEPVFLRHYGEGPKWVSGEVVGITGPLSYKVRTENGQEHRRHVDQLRRRRPSAAVHLPLAISEDFDDSLSSPPCNEADNELSDNSQPDVPPIAPSSTSSETAAPALTPQETFQRPVRLRVPPRRYQDSE